MDSLDAVFAVFILILFAASRLKPLPKNDESSNTYVSESFTPHLEEPQTIPENQPSITALSSFRKDYRMKDPSNKATYNRITGVLLIVCSYLALLAGLLLFSSERRDTSYNNLVIIVVSLTHLFSWYVGQALMKKARQYDAISPKQRIAEAYNPKPPLLYFRSFKDDARGSTIYEVGRGRGSLKVFVTEEEQIVKAMKSIGPVYTIGKPGEKLPDVGAIRIYPPTDEAWEKYVTTKLEKVHAVIIRAAHTDNLLWEIQETIRLIPPQRILLLIPFTLDEYEVFRTQAEKDFPRGLPNYNGKEVYGSLTGCIMFNHDWTSYFQEMKWRHSIFRSPGAPLVLILEQMCAPFFEHCKHTKP